MKHFLSTMALVFLFSALLTARADAAGTGSKKAPSEADKRQALLIELTGKDDTKMSDVDLYAEIVAAYQSRDEMGVVGRVPIFLNKHPKSPFADNVLYLAGRQALDRKNYAESIKYFQRLMTDYPNSNRVVSAQFAKAMAYKKMNLEPQARKVLRDIMKKYPGSPESFRADSEMRLLN